ncbi:HalOD1 output domain-containing protein [Natrialbaceae archaeon GCM10025810]|uniref:HalOD1 output domain-containing protein n=1 Tax=Halovalidus salilacus TaxID=3075124 RepID=UPI0036216E4C
MKSTSWAIGSDQSLLEEIVYRVARANDCEVSDLPILYETIDVEALEAICNSGPVKVTFEYAENTIVIENGIVTIL